MQWDAGHPCSVRNVQPEEQVLGVAERQPSISIRCLAAQTGTFLSSAHYTLQEQQLYPCRIPSVKELAINGCTCKTCLCLWILQHLLKTLRLQ